jgi:hypothetical protein
MTIGIVVKNYQHVNRSLPNWDTPNGKYISSKKQYDEEMAKGGFQPYDGRGRSERKKWTPSPELRKVLNEVKLTADRKGNIQPTEKLVNKMKSMGVSFNPKIMSNDLKGGIDASR